MSIKISHRTVRRPDFIDLYQLDATMHFLLSVGDASGDIKEKSDEVMSRLQNVLQENIQYLLTGDMDGEAEDADAEMIMSSEVRTALAKGLRTGQPGRVLRNPGIFNVREKNHG